MREDTKTAEGELLGSVETQISASVAPEILLRDNRGYEYRREGESLKAYDQGKEVGQIRLAVTETGRAVIVDIGVRKKYQKKGIGGQLTMLAEQVALEQGANEIGAIAQPDYLRALEKHGYKTSGFFATKKLEPR